MKDRVMSETERVVRGEEVLDQNKGESRPGLGDPKEERQIPGDPTDCSPMELLNPGMDPLA